jgi:hypothetical protein
MSTRTMSTAELVELAEHIAWDQGLGVADLDDFAETIAEVMDDHDMPGMPSSKDIEDLRTLMDQAKVTFPTRAVGDI